MALNPLKICWLEYLYKNKVFDGKKSILDLGPQDLTTKKDFIKKIVSYRFEPNELENILSKIYNSNGSIKENFQSFFYSLWELEEYYSLDYNDLRADYKYDLNKLHNFDVSFDIITNFGTAEHIFNIGIFFENLHNLLKPNGIALNVTPCYGDINHGFWNIHPNVYSQLIKTNKYYQHSFIYLDNYVGKNALLNETLDNYDFENIKIDLGSKETNWSDMQYLGKFREKVYKIFTENIKNENSLKYFNNPERGIFDYIFTAFEKTVNTKFTPPAIYNRYYIIG
ncbi:MAG: class I SAM-dependent methyltransferase [Arcobacteraceae bacterium]|nr:class I SAM-dependent methyltransferase [Arcobacteraceae bacterium]